MRGIRFYILALSFALVGSAGAQWGQRGGIRGITSDGKTITFTLPVKFEANVTMATTASDSFLVNNSGGVAATPFKVLNDATGSDSSVVVSANGYVAIRKSSGVSPLDVNGDVRASSLKSAAGLEATGSTSRILFQGTNLLIDSGDNEYIAIRTKPGGTPTERIRISSDGNFGLGTTSPGGGTTTGTNVLSIANGTAPAGGVADQASFYASDVAASSEMWVLDEAGNTTQLSPHDPVTGEWIFYSKNTKTGRVVRVNMEKLVKEIERLTGKKFLIETYETTN